MKLARSLITFHEGYREKCYRDTKGLWTWGIGWCLETRPLTLQEATNICELVGAGNAERAMAGGAYLRTLLDGMPENLKGQVAGYMCDQEIEKVEKELEERLPWFKNLTEVRQAALIDLAYNLGIGGLMQFKNTLKAMEEGRWNDVPDHLLDSQYRKDVGARAYRIAGMLVNGIWPNEVHIVKE